jgi:alpha-L-rhamnosidase
MKLKTAQSLFFLLVAAYSAQSQTEYPTNDSRAIVKADSTGIYCENYTWSPDRLFPKSRWKGEWIWLSKADFRDYQRTSTEWINNNDRPKQYAAMFRKDFEIETVPASAILCVTADVSFRMYVNGNFVCGGPPNIGSDYADSRAPQHWFFTTHDVKKYLHPGKNVIAVEAYSFGMAISETTSGEGKLICDLNAGLDDVILSTDSTWKCSLDTCLTMVNGVFVYDATHEIPDWKSIRFDDSGWPTASMKDTVRSGYLVESRIPSTIRYPVNPVKILATSPGKGEEVNERTLSGRVLHDDSLTFHFEKNMPAYYRFSLTAHEGDTVEVYPRENSDINRPFVYICREGMNSYTTPQLSVFNNLTLKIRSRKGLRIDTLYAIYSSYPVSYAGSFSCSDPFYTKLWEIIRWSTQMCMQSYHLDSPNHQEPISDTGDYLVESMSNYYAFGDRWLARQDLVKTAMMLKKNDYHMFHTSYSLLWVQMLYNYFQYTGDTVLVKELLPHVNKLNDLFATYLDRNFLLSQAPNYMFMDWTTIDGFNAHHPPAVIGMGYLTAFYYKSLMEASHLNRLCGNKSRSEHDIQLAGEVKVGINRVLWDKKKGLYKDGIPFMNHQPHYIWLPPDSDIVTYSPHFNSLAVLYDIAPKNRQVSIMNYVMHEKDIVVQPYFMYFVLSALAHVNRFATDGFAAMDEWKNDIDTNTFTLKEKWPDKNGYAGDLSHAWGGAPLYFMSSMILGIGPEKPGYKEIRFVPFVGDSLTWAKGTVPLSDGKTTTVSWKRSGRSDYTYRINLPKHYTALLVTPSELREYQLRINGKSYGTSIEKPIPISSGKYVIEYSRRTE